MKREEAVEVEIEGRRLVIRNLHKPLYPGGFNKGQVIDYYSRIAPAMLRHLCDRPVTMRRYVDGVDKSGFFEKHVPSHAPEWVRTVTVPSTNEKSTNEVEFAVVCDLPTLVWAANLACIEFHVPLWHAGKRRLLPAAPDFVVFDLDPGPGTAITECCVVAQLIKAPLEERGPTPVVKTSGSKGVQVYARLKARTTWDTSRALALDVAHELERSHPELVVSNMRKSLRENKVLIDWSQNHAAKTTVAVYSLRARTDPAASTPITWDEVATCADGGPPEALTFAPDEVLERVADHGDLFEGLVG